MIKNNRQLSNRKDNLRRIEAEIKDFCKKYSGIDLELFLISLQEEKEETLKEIIEYEELISLSFEDSVKGPLREPLLIDNIGEVLTKLRITSKKTQEEMANLLGWEQSNLSRFENENYSSQTIKKVVQYASTLGVYLNVFPSLEEIQEDIKFTIRDARTEKQEPASTTYGDEIAEIFDTAIQPALARDQVWEQEYASV